MHGRFFGFGKGIGGRQALCRHLYVPGGAYVDNAGNLVVINRCEQTVITSMSVNCTLQTLKKGACLKTGKEETGRKAQRGKDGKDWGKFFSG